MSGMGLVFHRLNNKMQMSVIVASVFVVLVGFIPNYEEMIYSQTEPVEWIEAQNYAGYPAGDDVPELASREEILKKGHSYTLVVDAGNIKPLHLFLSLSDHSVSDSAFMRFLNRDDNKNATGQLFSAELENGDTMIVLLDDYAVKLPQSGRVKLPIGKTKKMEKETIEYLTEKYNFSEDELAYYIDMAGSWRKSDIAERIVTVRISIAMVTFIIVVIGTYILLGKIERKEIERKERERKERVSEYRRKQGGS